jgi:transposase
MCWWYTLGSARETPHLTFHALNDELAARGVKVNAVWLFLRREGLRFKKTLFARRGRSHAMRAGNLAGPPAPYENLHKC